MVLKKTKKIYQKYPLERSKNTNKLKDLSETQKKRRRQDGSDGASGGTETFEAEGQLNLMMADVENLTEEEEYLRGIWANLGVGKNGYIDIDELARVCSHIGMEEMNDRQLQQLFDKLDADGDGRVSFREFLNELFQHSTPPSANHPTTPRSKGTTPTRAQSAQKKLKFPGSEERTTPSIVQGTGVTGLFSTIDPDRTGFAKPDAIIDLWEKYNVSSGSDVLLALGFELNAKVNLSELSAALEQELLNPEEQSIVYQAALASYQQEMRHLKSTLEQAVWAKDKLKLDLAEANARSNLLAKEVDERHASMEKSSESKLFTLLCGIKSTYLSIERKYQDQVKQLQSELDKERENYSTFTASHKQNIELEMEELKNEEVKLREQLVQAQKEIEKQSYDLEEVTGQLEESEKQCHRLQRELDSVEDIHRKLAEYETKGLLSPEEQKFTQEKLQRLELENKDLKDHNDELTAEIEHLKQQSTPSRKLGDGDVETHTPIRKEGSIMSDYIKPVIVKKTCSSSAEFSDDDTRTASAQGRRLPAAQHEDDDIIHKLKTDLKKLGITYGKGVDGTSDKETIEELRKELQELKDHFDIERREIEQACRLEITAVEERHDQEKAELLNHIEREKSKIADEFERLQQQALSELAKELQTNFAHEKEDLIEKQESEKNYLQQTFKEERERLREKVESELKDELQSRIEEVKSVLEQEKFQLEEALAETEPFICKLEEEKTQLEHKLARQKEQSETELKRQKTEMEGMLTRHMQKLEDVEKQKHEMELKYKKETSDSEISFRKEKMDLNNEIDRQAKDIRELQRQKAELELELKQQKDELELSFRQEKQEILELYEDKIRDLEDNLVESEKVKGSLLKDGVDSLSGKLRDDIFKLLDEAKKEGLIEDKRKLNEELQKQLEADFDRKKSELSHVFEKEKSELVEQYEEQIQSMRQELNRLQEKLEDEREVLAQRFDNEKEVIEEQLAQQLRDELEDEFCQQMEEIRVAYEEEKHEYEAQANLLKQEVEELQKALDDEDKNRRKIDELKRANNKLQQEKRQAEKGQREMQKALESTKQGLEVRIDELLAEKEGAVTAIKTQFVESSKQSGRDKAAYDALVIERDSLEKKVNSLSLEVSELQQQANLVSDLQREIEKLKKDNLELCQHIEDRTDVTYQKVPEHVQRAINELTREKSELEEKLVDMQSKYEEVEEMAKKYSHLQKKYEDVCKERDKVSHLAKSLKEELNKASTAQKEEHEDKGKLTSVLDEKKHLELQLQKISDKLLEATTNFSVSQSQHIRELQQWKEQCSNMVDLQKYTKLQIDLVDNQRSLRDLQELLQTKEETSTKVFKETSEKHYDEMKSLEEQKESLMRKLTTLQQILDGQIDKFKQQYEASEKRNALVVDLYKENADLIDALSRVEEQKKDAVSRCYRLEDQCNNLRRLLKRLAKVAVT